MIIKKQPVISWLLEDVYSPKNFINVKIPPLNNLLHYKYLSDGLKTLGQFRNSQPDFDIPEFIMPSFEEAMWKSANKLFHIYPELFKYFCQKKTCGILLHKDIGTIIYSFLGNTLSIWMFRNIDKYSLTKDHFYVRFTQDDKAYIINQPSIINDIQVYEGFTEEYKKRWYSDLYNYLMLYTAVKKYAPVETIVVPANGRRPIADENNINGYKKKEKIINESGQEVRIMDSRWFVKIVNDNDISVRSFFRMQPYKNEKGEWDRRLTLIPSHTRHGYHRNAGIEDESINL